MIRFLYLSGLFFLLSSITFAQNQVSIGILMDGDGSNLFLENELKKEINALLESQYQIEYSVLRSENDAERAREVVQEFTKNEEIDIMISAGLLTSIAMVDQTVYNKPALAMAIVDTALQNISLTASNTTGINNFTYVATPFSIQRDLEVFKTLYAYDTIGIVVADNFAEIAPEWLDYFNQQFPHIDYLILRASDPDMDRSLDQVDGVYLLPLVGYGINEVSDVIDKVNEKKLPSFSLVGRRYTELGVLGGVSPSINLTAIARRAALNVVKILEGNNPADIPVEYDLFEEDLTINISTADKIDYYPSWEVMSNASLLYIMGAETEQEWDLKSTVYEALRNNLEIKVAENETLAGEYDIDLARSTVLPQLDFSTNLIFIDSARANNSFGSLAPITWLATANLDQVIFSEPAIANIAIQKLLQQSREFSQDQVELDIILEASKAYLQVLQAGTIVTLQNNNVQTTRENYRIAVNKEDVGYSGPSDVYRWESELAINNVELNDARVLYQQAQLYFNQLLNQDQTISFKTKEVLLTDSAFSFIYDKIIPFLDNQGNLLIYADFMVMEAFENLPEIQQLNRGIEAQERLLASQKRSFYLPTFYLSGQADYNLQRINAADPLSVTIPPDNTVTLGAVPNDLQWTVAVGAQIPLFQGNYRKATKEQSVVNLDNLNVQKQDLKNKFELQIRSDVATLGASYSAVGLYEKAADAAEKNYEIASESYREGLISIVQLLDAQNAMVSTKIAATNAVFQFLIDYLTLERSSGVFHFLLTPREQEAFTQRLLLFNAK